MSINRGPFNALVDDDGTNTIGTPWNKQAIKDVVLDPVDAALTALPVPPYVVGGALPAPIRLGSSYVQFPMPPGAYNNFNPGGGGQNYSIWILGPTGTGCVINSIVAEPSGTMHLVFNEAGYVITLVNNASGSGSGRLVCPSFADLTIGSVSGFWIVYSTYFNGWMVLRG
jgi:hypothetical protein